MRVAWFLVLVVMLSIVLGAVKTYNMDLNSNILVATPETVNVNLLDPALTADGVSGLEQTTFGSSKGAGGMIYKVLVNSIIPLNVLGDGGGQLTQLLNQGINIFSILIKILSLVAITALIRGWVQF